jgi:hypothetical protein
MKTLTKEIPDLTVEVEAGQALPYGNSGGWIQAEPLTFVYHTFFDLAGMSQREKTMFFEGATIQEALPPFAPATAGDILGVADIMSTRQLTNAEAAAFISKANFPARGGSNLTYDQTIYGRIRVFNVDIDNAAGGYFITLSDNQVGSLEPTASDRIYCTRVVNIGATNSNGFYGVGFVRYLIRTNAREEPEYQYLMRLRRSYELQQSYDED